MLVTFFPPLDPPSLVDVGIYKSQIFPVVTPGNRFLRPMNFNIRPQLPHLFNSTLRLGDPIEPAMRIEVAGGCGARC